MEKKSVRLIIAGAAAGIITGTFGAGGGLILVPLLAGFGRVKEKDVFPSSVCIILSISIASLVTPAFSARIPWMEAWPYLIGSIIGGIISGLIGRRIPTLWLHRILGIMILYGGIRFLCK